MGIQRLPALRKNSGGYAGNVLEKMQKRGSDAME